MRFACMAMLCCGLLAQTPVKAADPISQDTIENILREKGIITKGDWVRIQAERERQEEEMRDRMDAEFPLDIGYGRSGFELKTRDGRFATQLQWRIQSRWSYPDSEVFTTISDFNDNPESTFELRRIRMKIGGHGYKSWLLYYFEIDLQPTREAGAESDESAVRLFDARITLDKFAYLSLRLGQWKVPFNRERRDSSGRLQFVERSIVNEFFTIDRQIGAMAYGRLAPGTVFDSHYYAGVYTGSGRGEANDDGNMMYFGRYQWNFLGRVLEFSQSDVEYHEQPAGNLAFAAYTTHLHPMVLDAAPYPDSPRLPRLLTDNFVWRAWWKNSPSNGGDCPFNMNTIGNRLRITAFRKALPAGGPTSWGVIPKSAIFLIISYT